ncbi:hypothetical protein AMJ57_01775, partial [Parcubacteria bacterium SG8_24]
VHTLTSTVQAILDGTEIFHYHGVGPSLLSWIPRIFAPRARVVATFHCIDRKHQKWGLLARLMLGLGERAACLFPHRTIVVSRTLQSYADNRFDRDTTYIPNGIETPPVQAGTATLDRFGLKRNGYIIMVSRLVRHKGAHYLIEAYRRLHEKGLTRGRRLVLVGDSAFTDDYVGELKQQAAGCPDIVFTGYLKGRALHEIFSHAYLVVHPSESEGLPIAVLEAMSYGKTVLASDIPENMEVTRVHGVNFRNKSVKDLTRKLRHLLDSPKYVRTKGGEARRFVISEYHWDDVAREVDGLYRSLTEKADPVTARQAEAAG